MADLIHAFERVGLGKAPFRVVGFGVEKFQACPGAPVQPGACCAFCGQGIMNVFRVRGADGSEFKVGPDCVARTGDDGLVSTAKRLANRAKREARHDASAALKADTLELLAREDVRAALGGLPHPLAFRAEQGATLLDWAEWMMGNAGMRGRSEVAATIKATLGGK